MITISPICIPAYGVFYKASNVKLKINNTLLSAGNLYITNKYLHWQGDVRNDGISIPWVVINLHTISKDPVKCVYFLLDYDLLRPGVLDRYSSKDSDVDEGNYEEDDEANRPSIVEICLIPSDTEEVDKIFHAIFQCQIWNPDSTYTLSEEEEFMEASDESGEELDAEEMENLNIDDE